MLPAGSTIMASDARSTMESPPSSDSPRGFASMRWARMALKELREILRDRRTIITLVAMPLLIYPLLGVTLQKLLVAHLATGNQIEYRIVLASNEDKSLFQQFFSRGHRLVAQREGRKLDPEHRSGGSFEDPFLEVMVPDEANAGVDINAIVAGGEADVAVRFGRRRGHDATIDLEIVYRSSSPLSRDARQFVESRLRAVNEDDAEKRLASLQPPEPLPLNLRVESLVRGNGPVGPAFSLATLVPLILILMTVTGAVYPAIDLTAGERERGTLEALVAAPVPRHELLFAKYLAVVSVAVLTALANLTSMIVTAYSSGLEGLLFGSGGLSVRLVASTLGLLFVFAAFFSAVILVLTSFARSFKEAQAYLIPVMLVSLAPGVICLLPGIEFNVWLSVLPLANIVLLARDVFDDRVVPIWALATLLSTVLYAAVALAAAARIFGTDAVLYGSEGTWADLLRRPDTPRREATLGQAMFGLAVMFPAFLILGGIPSRSLTLSVSARLMANAGITLVLFAGLPLLLAYFTAVRWRSGFSAQRASFRAFVAAVLLGLSLWPFAYELELLLLSPQRLEAFSELFKSIKLQLDAIPLGWKLLTLAIIPALCEELFFRGYLQTAFRAGMAGPLAVIFSSMLFGLFHVIVRDALFFERFVPSCFLGLVLGTVCLRTGSVWPGMLLHALHNGFLLTLAHSSEHLQALGIGIEEEQHLPTRWLLISATVAVTGFGILAFCGREKCQASKPEAECS
jgi:sodium transport system permease protein